MFKKVLIANRGEIAVRVIRACHERGLQTVAVYSDGDRAALHVRRATEAYPLGGVKAAESYLRIDKILDVAKRSGADAIHPGYGFLAENSEFARACRDAGLVFIGPPPEAMDLMGDKVAARRAMRQAGVPVIPGTDELRSDAEAFEAIGQLGYPVLIKAAAGGGGKGMRTVREARDLPGALEAARREAKAAFGDDTVYLERVVENARHIEFQVLADEFGNVIHLGERECSIQRRHQKMIEEAPSPALDPELRQRMGEVAVKAARAANYVNTGTIEFLLSPNRNFYFLEMNTRLQVEHPVTEMVTGVDLVKEMLRIASGRKLRYTQDQIEVDGWAMECRITAEDPYNNFLPSIGTINSLTEPTGPGIRMDSGVYEGYEVSLFYDPLIAKLIAWGEDRAETILRMRRALNEYRIVGIQTSIPFHQQVMDMPSFIGGQFDTTFVETRYRYERHEACRLGDIAAILATLLFHERRQQAASMPATHAPQSIGSPWKYSGRPGRGRF